MRRVFAGVLAVALIMGTTASQADAASKAGVITSISLYGNGGTSLAACAFNVTVSYGTIRQSNWHLYGVILTWTGNNWRGSNVETIAKASSSKTMPITALVNDGVLYFIQVETQKVVRGSYATVDSMWAGPFTQGATCASAGTLLTSYP